MLRRFSRTWIGFFLLLLWSHGALADALSDWLDLEQTRIDRSVNPQRIFPPDVQNQNQTFRPEARGWFDLKSVWVPESELLVAQDELDFPRELGDSFARTRDGKREYRLLIHPESETFYKSLMERYPPVEIAFQATSTASSRTVLVRDKRKPTATPFFAKLSLDVELGGVRRTIPSGEVVRSVGTSRYLRELENRKVSDNFVHMPEVFGVIPKGWERGGMILRLVPESVSKGERKLVPLFSLYFHPESGPSLIQKLANDQGLSPEEFTRKHILEPFYRGWVDWGVDGAVTMEAHAQNFLLELNQEGKPTGRFVHRDLGGFNIDSQSPFFDRGTSMPSFSNFNLDYHQNFVQKAREESLYNYFEGGFLYNLDKELARAQPDYPPGRILTTSHQLLAEALARKSGLSHSQFTQLDLSTGPGVAEALKLAQRRHYRNKNPGLLNRCAEAFEWLISGGRY